MRRALGWAAALLLLVGAAAGLATYTAAGVQPTALTRGFIAGAPVLAAFLLYGLLDAHRAGVDPVMVLWTRLLLVLGLLGAIEVTPYVFERGAAAPETYLPSNLPTAAIAVPRNTREAQKSPIWLVSSRQLAASQMPNALPPPCSIASPIVRTTAIATKPTMNSGMRVFQLTAGRTPGVACCARR